MSILYDLNLKKGKVMTISCNLSLMFGIFYYVNSYVFKYALQENVGYCEFYSFLFLCNFRFNFSLNTIYGDIRIGLNENFHIYRTGC